MYEVLASFSLSTFPHTTYTRLSRCAATLFHSFFQFTFTHTERELYIKIYSPLNENFFLLFSRLPVLYIACIIIKIYTLLMSTYAHHIPFHSIPFINVHRNTYTHIHIHLFSKMILCYYFQENTKVNVVRFECLTWRERGLL